MTYRTDQSSEALAEWTARIHARIAAALQADHEQRIATEWVAEHEDCIIAAWMTRAGRSRSRIAGAKQ